MNILRLAFKLDPKSASKIMKKLIMMTKKFQVYSQNLLNKKLSKYEDKVKRTRKILVRQIW